MNEFRVLDKTEITMVAGGLSPTPGSTFCPVDEWWNPNWLTDDAGSIGEMPAMNGPIDGYWTDGTIWCLYDTNNNLLGVYVEDPNSSFQLTFESNTQVDGQLTNSVGDSTTGGSYTVSLRKIG